MTSLDLIRLKTPTVGTTTRRSLIPSMRILHVIPSMNPADGGPVTMVRALVAATSTLNCESHILCLDPPNAGWLKELECDATAVGPGRGPFGTSRRMRDWLLKNAHRLDIVVVHGLWLYPTQCAQECWRRTRLPYVVYTHGMLDVTHRQMFPFRHLKKSLRWLTCERSVLSEAAALLFTCDAERDLAANTFWPKLPLHHSRIAPCCVEAPPENPEKQIHTFRTAFPHLSESRLLLFLSRIHPKKGVDLLLEAFAICAQHDPRLMLMIAGPGDSRYVNQLRQRAASAGIADRVTWPGMLVGDLKWGALRSAELFCLPSHQENFGIAITEALACGTPVLISNQVNIAKQIGDADAAIICNDDLVSTTKALSTWLQLPHDEKQSMKRAARACFQTQFHSDTAAKRFLNAITISIPATGNREHSQSTQLHQATSTTE